MTSTSAASQKRKSKKNIRSLARRATKAYMCIFLLILFFKNSSAATLWITRGLKLCADKLIPSLFPFMVVSSLMVSSGAGTVMFKFLSLPFNKLFGVGRECCTPIVMGWLCGFPVGAKCASELYGQSKISASEYTKILCISSTPSPAFLIGTVGTGMLGSTASGIRLYCFCIISCIAVGLFMRFSKHSAAPQKLSAALPSHDKKMSLAKALTHSVTDSARGMLSVCAFVVFFSAFLGSLEGALSFAELADTARALLFSFFEITTGISMLSALPRLSLPLCALAAGWSGLSVHFQTAAICSEGGASFGAYILSHIAKSAICILLATILL